jgi:quinol monooxygenase YgiN
MILRREFLFGAVTTALLLPGGPDMERFGFFGKFLTKAGQRDVVLGYLREAAKLVSALPGCQIYIINTVPNEPDAICSMEVWNSEADHSASLQLESVKAIVAKARPLMAEGGEVVRMVPAFGKGLS